MTNARSPKTSKLGQAASSQPRFRDLPFEDAQFEDVRFENVQIEDVQFDDVGQDRKLSTGSTFDIGVSAFGRKSSAKPISAKPEAQNGAIGPSTAAFEEAQQKDGMSVFDRSAPINQKTDDRVAFYGFATVLVVLAFWVSGGHAVFNRADSITTASIAAAPAYGQGELIDSNWEIMGEGGKRALKVEGIVRNPGNQSIHAGPVLVRLEFADGSRSTFNLGREGWTLAAGHEILVSGRLDISAKPVASVTLSLSN
jgi:hypothetical protein